MLKSEPSLFEEVNLNDSSEFLRTCPHSKNEEKNRDSQARTADLSSEDRSSSGLSSK